MPMKPCTLESHSTLYCVPTGPSHSCLDRFQNYWVWVHFHHEPHSYSVQLDSLTPDEVMMKRDMETIYLIFGYKEGFGLIEVNL